MSVDAGRLDQRITLQRATDTPDAQGSTVKTWTDRGTVWARAESIAAAETTQGNARVATQNYRFTIRFQSAMADLNAADRVVWNGLNHDILSAVPMPEGRPDKIIITAQRKA